MNEHTIYLGGGCFWGCKDTSKIEGVLSTEVGCPNGPTENPSYEDVCHNSGHVEALKVTYDADTLSLDHLIQYFLRAIDPFSVNKQGGDVGIQSTVLVFTIRIQPINLLLKSTFARAQTFEGPTLCYRSAAFRELLLPRRNIIKITQKNPNGYCHIPLGLSDEPLIDDNAIIINHLKNLQMHYPPQEYEVTQNSTDAPLVMS